MGSAPEQSFSPALAAVVADASKGANWDLGLPHVHFWFLFGLMFSLRWIGVDIADRRSTIFPTDGGTISRAR
jgi:hypothetical protein